MEVHYTDIKDTQSFSRHGFTHNKVYADDNRHIYIFEVTDKETRHYEVVLGKRHKNPDGNIVFSYPGNADWGKLGFTIRGCNGMDAAMRVVKELETSVKNKNA